MGSEPVGFFIAAEIHALIPKRERMVFFNFVIAISGLRSCVTRNEEIGKLSESKISGRLTDYSKERFWGDKLDAVYAGTGKARKGR
jgi:hypothetical protein